VPDGAKISGENFFNDNFPCESGFSKFITNGFYCMKRSTSVTSTSSVFCRNARLDVIMT
jgi:hypothetical protein